MATKTTQPKETTSVHLPLRIIVALTTHATYGRCRRRVRVAQFSSARHNDKQPSDNELVTRRRLNHEMGLDVVSAAGSGLTYLLRPDHRQSRQLRCFSWTS